MEHHRHKGKGSQLVFLRVLNSHRMETHAFTVTFKIELISPWPVLSWFDETDCIVDAKLFDMSLTVLLVM